MFLLGSQNYVKRARNKLDRSKPSASVVELVDTQDLKSAF